VESLCFLTGDSLQPRKRFAISYLVKLLPNIACSFPSAVLWWARPVGTSINFRPWLVPELAQAFCLHVCFRPSSVTWVIWFHSQEFIEITTQIWNHAGKNKKFPVCKSKRTQRELKPLSLPLVYRSPGRYPSFWAFWTIGIRTKSVSPIILSGYFPLFLSSSDISNSSTWGVGYMMGATGHLARRFAIITPCPVFGFVHTLEMVWNEVWTLKRKDVWKKCKTTYVTRKTRPWVRVSRACCGLLSWNRGMLQAGLMGEKLGAQSCVPVMTTPFWLCDVR
jgi:hypothetical protein